MGYLAEQVDPDAKPSNVGPPFSGQFKVVVDMPKSFRQKQTQVASNKPQTLVSTTTTTTDSTDLKHEPDTQKVHEPPKPSIKRDFNLELRKNVYDTSETKAQQAARFLCASCNRETDGSRYRNTKAPEMLLCSDCFNNAKLPSDTAKEDFVEEGKDSDVKKEQAWSPQEEMLLLEGLEMFEDDWNAVAEHVGTRSRDECILHYLQLPIEDPTVDGEVSGLGLLRFDAAQAKENPIMSVVAFLASTVKPKVAAAASQSQTLEKDTQSSAAERKPSSPEANGQAQDDEKREIMHKLIRTKLEHFQVKAAHFAKLEIFVEEEKRQLERERHQLSLERFELKNLIMQTHNELAKRGGMTSSIANSITPAQIQQQIAGGSIPSGPHLYMNPAQAHQQHQLHLQRQQQYQMQLKRQMQAQQGHQFQQQPPGHNMMSF